MLTLTKYLQFFIFTVTEIAQQLCFISVQFSWFSINTNLPVKLCQCNQLFTFALVYSVICSAFTMYNKWLIKAEERHSVWKHKRCVCTGECRKSSRKSSPTSLVTISEERGLKCSGANVSIKVSQQKCVYNSWTFNGDTVRRLWNMSDQALWRLSGELVGVLCQILTGFCSDGLFCLFFGIFSVCFIFIFGLILLFVFLSVDLRK